MRAGLPPYNGRALPRAAVVVTINYRLGHLGFLPIRAGRREERVVHNFALLIRSPPRNG